jgi:hypothetical protein
MTAIGTAVAGEWRFDHEPVSFGMVEVRSRWRLVSLRLLFVATLLVGCSRPPRFAPVSQADRTTVASFFGTLKHDPALFLVIRPDRLASGTAPIEKLLGSLEPAEREGLRGSLHDFFASDHADGLRQFSRIFADGVPKDLQGWDERRPILAAFDGTDTDEDLSLLFRAFLADPGEVSPRALHHSLSIPATDRRALLGSLAQLLAQKGFASLAADAPGTASFSFGQFEPKGFVALSTEESAVRVEIVTEESPVWSAPPQAAGSVAAPRGSPRDVARNVEPFEELAGSGADAVVVYLRTRNFFRREFVRWLGVVAQTRLLSDPASKHSMLAKGTAELLAVYPFMSSSQARPGADVAVGLDLNRGVGVRIVLHDDRARPASENRAQIPLPSIFDPAWYRTAATAVGTNGIPSGEAADILEGGGNFASAFVIANDPDRALPALAASRSGSASGRFPVRWVGGARPKHESSRGAECLALAARAMQSHFGALADWAAVANEERRSEQRLAELGPALACAAADDRFAAQAKAIRLAWTLVRAQDLAAELRRDEAAQLLATECRAGETEACARENELGETPKNPVLANSAKLSPEDRAAIGTARSWFHSVMAGEREQAIKKTALPFTLTVEGPYYRSSFDGRLGSVSTRDRLLKMLGELTTFCGSWGCCETGSPHAAVHVRTAPSGIRIVSFIPNGNELADGSYFNVYVHVDSSTGLVVRAVFKGLHTG